MDTPQTRTPYDEVPYESHAFAQTHPDRLATIARLFGLTATPVTRCRVLELGCASGGNLIPMAFNLPDSAFVGIDLSARQVGIAHKTIDDLGLDNVRIDHASILDIDVAMGSFDYIICHGVYSWVPDDVQDKILSVCSGNLTPNGIAYVSYNTYPGWHMREIIRHAMRYHADQFEDKEKRIEQARALIDFLVGAVPVESGYYGHLLKSELELVRRSRDSYLFHEHLEDVNTPTYFHQFIEKAQRHNLQYLGEAEFATMLTSGFPSEIAQTLDRISPDIIRSEQYMDFLRNRFFRQTLLCHNDNALKRELNADSVRGLLVASNVQRVEENRENTKGATQTFRTAQGLAIATDFPPTKAALSVLNAYWPHAIALDTLIDEVRSRLSTVKDEHNQRTLFDDLLHCYTLNAVEFHTWQADLTPTVSGIPKISALARYQLAHDQPIVNQRHETVNLDNLGKALARILDGCRDKTALLTHLRRSVECGDLVMESNGKPLLEEDQILKALEQALNKTLQKLAGAALLVS